jgi:peptidoglycan/xylan/chitin deacetylase (PgdA/CDA1 family)
MVKKVVLTFDDGVKSHYTRVAPLLKEYNMRATFFVTNAKDTLWWRLDANLFFRALNEKGMSWEEIKELHDDGFEIGNHTWSHVGMSYLENVEAIQREVYKLNDKLADFGIPTPTTFCYPGYLVDDIYVAGLKASGISFARSGYLPGNKMVYLSDVSETPYYIPGVTDRFRVPCTGVLGAWPNPADCYTIDRFERDMDRMPDGHVAVLGGHGVVHDKVFNDLVAVVEYIAKSGYTVICLRDLPA